jgi:hypothetical protein
MESERRVLLELLTRLGGQAHVFYPEVSDERCTAALMLDVDSGLVRRGVRFPRLDQYVNDRPSKAGLTDCPARTAALHEEEARAKR